MQITSEPSNKAYMNHRTMKEDVVIFDTEEKENVTLKNEEDYFFMNTLIGEGEYMYEIGGFDVSKNDYENALNKSKEVEYSNSITNN